LNGTAFIVGYNIKSEEWAAVSRLNNRRRSKFTKRRTKRTNRNLSKNSLILPAANKEKAPLNSDATTPNSLKKLMCSTFNVSSDNQMSKGGLQAQ
jgi:hypothetical protein